MILHIVKKEILENFLSLRFAITSVLCFLVITASIGILGKEYVDDLYDYNRNVRDHRDSLEKQNRARDVIWGGIIVDKPIAKMSIFNKGIDDNGRSSKIYGSREPEYYTKKGKNPVTFLFPAIDLLFFVSIIMSLLAIVFSYDAISGEKFNETLKLMVSYPVSRARIIIGKWIGGFICLMLPFLLSVSAGMLILYVIVPDLALTGQEYLRLLLLIFLAGLYISIVYTFGIMISANTEKPSSSITVLLLVWVVMVLVVPNISSSVASFLTKTENVQAIEGQKRKIIVDAHQSYREEMHRYRRKHRLSWHDPEFRVFREKLEKERFLKTRRSLENVNRNFRMQMNGRVALTKWISRLSPLASFKYAAGLLTETGYREDFSFRSSVDDYGREVLEFVYDAKIEEAEDRFRVQTKKQEKREFKFEPDKAPKFDYARIKKDHLDFELAEMMIDVGFMLCWNVILFILAFVAFIRYDVK